MTVRLMFLIIRSLHVRNTRSSNYCAPPKIFQDFEYILGNRKSYLFTFKVLT